MGALFDHGVALLGEVAEFRQPAEQVLAAYGRRHPRLGARDRRVLGDVVFEWLRRRRRYEAQAQRLPLLGVAALRLQAAAAWPGPLDEPALADWRARAGDAGDVALLPAWLGSALELAGSDAVDALLQPAPLDLRVNVLKSTPAAVRAVLADAGVQADPTTWSPWGLRVRGRPALERLAAFQRGEFEVQDEGSQLLALLVGARRGETVVDFCAGAGGKTLALGAAMRGSGHLWAIDRAGARLAALAPRLARSGLTHVHCMHVAHEHDARLALLAGKADRVLVDAPCSGLGTLRRHPDLAWRQTPQAVTAFVAAQQALLVAAANLVKAGGRLVYATCSPLHEENEAVAAAFDRRDFERVAAESALPRALAGRGLTDGAALRLWPHRHGTDAYFAAVWRRR